MLVHGSLPVLMWLEALITEWEADDSGDFSDQVGGCGRCRTTNSKRR